MMSKNLLLFGCLLGACTLQAQDRTLMFVSPNSASPLFGAVVNRSGDVYTVFRDGPSDTILLQDGTSPGANPILLPNTEILNGRYTGVFEESPLGPIDGSELAILNARISSDAGISHRLIAVNSLGNDVTSLSSDSAVFSNFDNPVFSLPFGRIIPTDDSPAGVELLMGSFVRESDDAIGSQSPAYLTLFSSSLSTVRGFRGLFDADSPTTEEVTDSLSKIRWQPDTAREDALRIVVPHTGSDNETVLESAALLPPFNPDVVADRRAEAGVPGTLYRISSGTEVSTSGAGIIATTPLGDSYGLTIFGYADDSQGLALTTRSTGSDGCTMGDLNGDEIVDARDVLALAQCLDPKATCETADLNRNGRVDFVDFGKLAGCLPASVGGNNGLGIEVMRSGGIVPEFPNHTINRFTSLHSNTEGVAAITIKAAKLGGPEVDVVLLLDADGIRAALRTGPDGDDSGITGSRIASIGTTVPDAATTGVSNVNRAGQFAVTTILDSGRPAIYRLQGTPPFDPVADQALIVDYLLARAGSSSGRDINRDGRIDGADVVTYNVLYK